MRRRTVLQWLASVPGWRTWAQTAGFPGKHADVLRELAAVVLPGVLGRERTDRVARQFEGWVRAYRPGAEMDHGRRGWDVTGGAALSPNTTRVAEP